MQHRRQESGIEGARREGKVMTVVDQRYHAPDEAQILNVDRGHLQTALTQYLSHVPGAGTDVEHAAHPCQFRLQRRGQCERPAPPAAVDEPPRGRAAAEQLNDTPAGEVPPPVARHWLRCPACWRSRTSPPARWMRPLPRARRWSSLGWIACPVDQGY